MTSSSNASDVALAPPSPWAARARLANEELEPERESGELMLWKVGPTGDVGDVGGCARWGDAPSIPIIEGSRW